MRTFADSGIEAPHAAGGQPPRLFQPPDITEAYLFEPMEVSALVGLLRGFTWQLRELRFTVQVDIPQDCPLYDAAFRLAFDNVVENAVRYSADGRSLRVTATAVDRHVGVEIFDCGMASQPTSCACHAPLFPRPGCQSRWQRPRADDCARILSDHDGALVVSSEVGRGTTYGSRFHRPDCSCPRESWSSRWRGALPAAAHQSRSRGIRSRYVADGSRAGAARGSARTSSCST